MYRNCFWKMLLLVAAVFSIMSLVSCSSDDDDKAPKKETLKSLKAGFRISLSTDVIKYFDVTAVITDESTGESKTEAITKTSAETSRFTATKVPQTYKMVLKFARKADTPEFITSQQLVISCKGIYDYSGTNGSFRTNVLCTSYGETYRLEKLENAPVEQIIKIINNSQYTYTLTETDVTFDKIWD